jgi:16S rRNA (guanine966-N2)-methyltransferase
VRVIGGAFKGRKLVRFQGRSIRPTADRLREAMFNILGRRMVGVRVLDLFAGSGALGIEALSRGATDAIFVEKSPGSIATLRRNIDICRLKDRARIIRWDVVRNLDCLRAEPAAFSLVFMDPPYGQAALSPALDHLRGSGCLCTGACIVIEHALAEPLPETGPAYRLDDQRRYGKSLVSFLTYML